LLDRPAILHKALEATLCEAGCRERKPYTDLGIKNRIEKICQTLYLLRNTLLSFLSLTLQIGIIKRLMPTEWAAY
jgi:hypothetical protein